MPGSLLGIVNPAIFVRAAQPRRLAAAVAALLFVSLVALTAPLQAQTRKELGRMWTYESAPLGWFQEAYDWQPTPEWLEHARMASLRLGQRQANGEIRYFCSASFVSSYGLVMTNHHCARDAIVSVQGEDDWLKDGFYAGGYDGEPKVPGLLCSQLIAQKDVTAEVNEQGQDAVLAAAEQANPELSHQVISLYQGGSYQLYSFKLYEDLRLVCAPHGQSAHFGGDPDNFCYPRWGLDFSFVRAYENGRPADTKQHHFQWRTEGADEGELVFVTGNPGRTGRLKTLAQCEFMRDHYYPPLVKRYERMVATMRERSAADAAYEKNNRAQLLRFENGRKALQGYLDGLLDDRILAIKEKAERDLRAEGREAHRTEAEVRGCLGQDRRDPAAEGRRVGRRCIDRFAEPAVRRAGAEAREAHRRSLFRCLRHVDSAGCDDVVAPQ